MLFRALISSSLVLSVFSASAFISTDRDPQAPQETEDPAETKEGLYVACTQEMENKQTKQNTKLHLLCNYASFETAAEEFARTPARNLTDCERRRPKPGGVSSVKVFPLLVFFVLL